MGRYPDLDVEMEATDSSECSSSASSPCSDNEFQFSKSDDESDNDLPIRKRKGFQHKCPHCSHRSKAPNKLREHIHAHHSLAHCCSECEERFDDYHAMRTHMSKQHRKPHCCEFCDYKHLIRANVVKHTKLNHTNGVKCTVDNCNLRVALRKLKAHIKDCHTVPDESLAPTVKTKSYFQKCPICDFQSSDMESFNIHMDKFHSEGTACPFPECGILLSMTELHEHLKAEHHHENGLDVPSSDSGSKDDSWISSAVTATTSTSGLDPEELFMEDDVLDMETESSTVPKGKRALAKRIGGMFVCNTCNGSYRNMYILMKHVKTVHQKLYAVKKQARRHVCTWEKCAKSFATQGLLEDHLNVHNDVMPWHCESCDRRFHARARFAVHLSKYHRTSIKQFAEKSRLRDQLQLTQQAEMAVVMAEDI